MQPGSSGEFGAAGENAVSEQVLDIGESIGDGPVAHVEDCRRAGGAETRLEVTGQRVTQHADSRIRRCEGSEFAIDEARAARTSHSGVDAPSKINAADDPHKAHRTTGARTLCDSSDTPSSGTSLRSIFSDADPASALEWRALSPGQDGEIEGRLPDRREPKRRRTG
jgi:hypothetical protein